MVRRKIFFSRRPFTSGSEGDVVAWTFLSYSRLGVGEKEMGGVVVEKLGSIPIAPMWRKRLTDST